MKIRRTWRIRPVSAIAALAAALFFSFFCLRPIWAETLDLSAYDKASDAERYLALPYSGPNFSANSYPGYAAGRYYLKGKAAAVVISAYESLRESHPEYRYLYGETGWKGGGRFPPHRTHQHGLTADFMTPVRMLNNEGKESPAILPCNALNLWGYEIRLGADGRWTEYRLDTRAMVAHLAALNTAGRQYGLRIERVIFDPPLLKLLRADPGFSRLKGVRFLEKKAWFPHDGHYHVDFAEIR